MGDPRFKVGAENPNKHRNIVQGNLDGFRRLYAPILDTCPILETATGAEAGSGGPDDAAFRISSSRDRFLEAFAQLPGPLQEMVSGAGAVAEVIAGGKPWRTPGTGTVMRQALVDLTEGTATKQAMKGGRHGVWCGAGSDVVMDVNVMS